MVHVSTPSTQEAGACSVNSRPEHSEFWDSQDYRERPVTKKNVFDSTKIEANKYFHLKKYLYNL